MATGGFDSAGSQIEKVIADLEDLATLIGEIAYKEIKLNNGTTLVPGLGMNAEAKTIQNKIRELMEITSEKKLQDILPSTRELAGSFLSEAYSKVTDNIDLLVSNNIVSNRLKNLTLIQEMLFELSGKNHLDVFLTPPEIGKIISLYSKVPPFIDIPNDLSAVLERIMRYKTRLNNSELRVSFFGVFSAGKSSLINALLDASLLPVKANRATGTITTVCYADKPSAQIVRTVDGKEIDISFDKRDEYILIDSLESGEYLSHEVREVRLKIPSPLIEEGVVFADTPGIMDDNTLTEIAFESCEYSDLVVMVLSGNRILSDKEKQCILRINEMLNGNIIFAVNKYDTLRSKADRKEISEIASQTLKNMGNEIVGKPKIFYVASDDIPSAYSRDSLSSSSINQLQDLKEWMSNLFSSPNAIRVMWNARLSVMNEYLKEASILADEYLKKETENIKKLDEEIKKATTQNRLSHEKKVNSVRSDIYKVARTLDECENDCFNIWIRTLDSFISSNSNWGSNSNLDDTLEEGLSKYCNMVNNKYSYVQKNMNGYGIASIPFSLNASEVPFSIVPVKSSSFNKICGAGAVLGGLLLGPLGLVGGGILAAVVANEYDGTATLNLAKSKKEELFQFLNLQNSLYIRLLENQINNYTPKHLPDRKLSLQLTAAKEKQKNYLKLKQWCDELSSNIQNT